MENILAKINQSAISILASQSIQEVCKIIVEEGKNLVAAEQGTIYLLKKNKLELAYTSNTQITHKKNIVLQHIIKRGEISILRSAALIEVDPRFKLTNIRSAIIIPLVYHQKTIGVLILYSTNEEFISEKELDILNLFRSVASIALEKTQLHIQAQNALEVRDRFIAFASHELRTPLTSINGYIQLLYGKYQKQETPEARWIKELYTESSRLTHLVKQLLDVNRIKQGQFQILFSEVNIKKIIENAIENFHYTNMDGNLIFTDESENDNNTIIGDKEKLLQMFSSLLNVAAKFSKPKTSMKIYLQTSKKYVHIQIINDGSYIGKQELENIIEGVYKDTKQESKEGIGIGLLVSKHIIETHKGKLQINSKKNKGTIIEVKLPYAKL
jgi:K+-sensing histidine kinase KdpD